MTFKDEKYNPVSLQAKGLSDFKKGKKNQISIKYLNDNKEQDQGAAVLWNNSRKERISWRLFNLTKLSIRHQDLGNSLNIKDLMEYCIHKTSL